jgi:hypothetical protein
MAEGGFSEAAELFRQALTTSQGYRWTKSLSISLFGMAAWSGASGDWARGARWLGAARAHLIQGYLAVADQQELGRFQAAAQQALGKSAYQAALQAGENLGLDQAVAEALREWM